MRTFIQLKNGIGYATLTTPSDSPDHSVTPDHITAIEVFTTDAEQFLKKKYDPATKTWSDAPLLVWCELNERGQIIEIRRTYFEDEIKGPLMTETVRADSIWVDNNWVHSGYKEAIAEALQDPKEGAGQPMLENNSEA